MKRIKKDYLSSLYSELYVRDIAERGGMEREDILNDILNDILGFLASQISSLTNPTNIANALTSMKNEKVNSTLVSNYVQHIIDSFLISMVKRYNVKGKPISSILTNTTTRISASAIWMWSWVWRTGSCTIW